MTQPTYHPGYLGAPTPGAEALNQPANCQPTANFQSPTEFIEPMHDLQPQAPNHQEAAASPEPDASREPFRVKEFAAEFTAKAGAILFGLGSVGFAGFGGYSLVHAIKALGLDEASPFIKPDAWDAYVQQYMGHVHEAQESVSPMFTSLGGMALGAGGILISNILSRQKKQPEKPKIPLHTSPPTP